MGFNMQYEVHLLDIKTDKMFTKYIKNDYFLRLFVNKVNKGQKLIILDIKDLYR